MCVALTFGLVVVAVSLTAVVGERLRGANRSRSVADMVGGATVAMGVILGSGHTSSLSGSRGWPWSSGDGTEPALAGMRLHGPRFTERFAGPDRRTRQRPHVLHLGGPVL